jgi:hypothetical protein
VTTRSLTRSMPPLSEPANTGDHKKLPEVMETVTRGARIWMVEGEKDVYSLAHCNVTATTTL